MIKWEGDWDEHWMPPDVLCRLELRPDDGFVRATCLVLECVAFHPNPIDWQSTCQRIERARDFDPVFRLDDFFPGWTAEALFNEVLSHALDQMYDFTFSQGVEQGRAEQLEKQKEYMQKMGRSLMYNSVRS